MEREIYHEKIVTELKYSKPVQCDAVQTKIYIKKRLYKPLFV